MMLSEYMDHWIPYGPVYVFLLHLYCCCPHTDAFYGSVEDKLQNPQNAKYLMDVIFVGYSYIS